MLDLYVCEPVPVSLDSRATPLDREQATTRHGANSISSRWLVAALDELDYGIVVLDTMAHAVHVNHAAIAELGPSHALHLRGRRLLARSPRDETTLTDAVEAAANRGLRRMLTLGAVPLQTSFSIVPLGEECSNGHRAVLVVFARRAVSETLSMEGYARIHRLTPAETRVLVALCAGIRPVEAASRLGVALATVRSHIGSIRAKTGATSIRSLVSQVALLPPVKGVLGRGAASTPPLDMFIK